MTNNDPQNTTQKTKK